MNSIIEIKAKEGMYLTQVEDTNDRIYCKSIYGKSEVSKNWRDATQEERDKYYEEQALKENLMLEENNENI